MTKQYRVVYQLDDYTSSAVYEGYDFQEALQVAMRCSVNCSAWHDWKDRKYVIQSREYIEPTPWVTWLE